MPSERESLAQALADTCVFGGLNESYGVNVARGEARGRNFWSVTFARARYLAEFKVKVVKEKNHDQNFKPEFRAQARRRMLNTEFIVTWGA